MVEKEIVIPNMQLIDISELKTDGNNPNVMTPEQIKALKKDIQEYGFIVPIITNKDLVVADGEQRLTAAKELGMQQVSIIQLNVKEVDRLIIRQVMNKLKGEHDQELDIAQFKLIEDYEEGGLERLSNMVGQESEHFKKMVTVHEHLRLHPNEQEFDENIEVNNECPKCHYKW